MTPEKLSKMYTDVSNVCWKCEAQVGSYYHMWWSYDNETVLEKSTSYVATNTAL